MNFPAGIADRHLELFSTPTGLMAIYAGKILAWKAVPRRGKSMVRKDLERHPEVLSILRKMKGSMDERLRIYAHCQFGGFNTAPDIMDCGTSKPEHWECNCADCPLREVLRGKLRVANGQLTEREIQVARAIALGKMGKEIAADLDISESTLNSHKKSIFTKVGVLSNVELATWASKNSLI